MTLPSPTLKVQRTETSRLAQTRIGCHRRLAPVADLDVGMNSITYSIKCPKCSAKASARTHLTGERGRGSFREPTLELGVGRILCGACGLCRDVPAKESGDYELGMSRCLEGIACGRATVDI